MAYDSQLAERVRALVRPVRETSEREQFGGVAFLLRGNVACGVLGADLLVRVGPARHEEAMTSKQVRPFSLTGKPSRGWVLVRPAGLKTAATLKKWVEMGMDFARTLPKK